MPARVHAIALDERACTQTGLTAPMNNRPPITISCVCGGKRSNQLSQPTGFCGSLLPPLRLLLPLAACSGGKGAQ